MQATCRQSRMGVEFLPSDIFLGFGVIQRDDFRPTHGDQRSIRVKLDVAQFHESSNVFVATCDWTSHRMT